MSVIVVMSSDQKGTWFLSAMDDVSAPDEVKINKVKSGTRTVLKPTSKFIYSNGGGIISLQANGNIMLSDTTGDIRELIKITLSPEVGNLTPKTPAPKSDSIVSPNDSEKTKQVFAECERLVDELNKFKGKSDFKTFGFRPDGPAGAWMKQINDCKNHAKPMKSEPIFSLCRIT